MTAPLRFEPPDQAHYRALARTGFFGEQAAGCIPWSRSTSRFLLLKRSALVEEPGTWGCPGGAHHKSEAPAAAALRELREETGYPGPVKLIEARPFEHGSFRYSNFIAFVDEEFVPDLGWEATDYRWCAAHDLPTSLHFGIEELFGPMDGLVAAAAAIDAVPATARAPARPLQALSPSLREWIAGSWLMDEHGSPIVAYHGSAWVFDRFDISKAGLGRGLAAERALFFTLDPGTANHSALVMGANFERGLPTAQGTVPDNSGVIYPVYLRTVSPCVSHLDRYKPDVLADNLAEAAAAGHDAVLFPRLNTPGERETIAVFGPDQVRSIFS